MAAYEALSGRALNLGAVRLCGVVQGLCELALAHREPVHKLRWSERARACRHGYAAARISGATHLFDSKQSL